MALTLALPSLLENSTWLFFLLWKLRLTFSPAPWFYTVKKADPPEIGLLPRSDYRIIHSFS